MFIQQKWFDRACAELKLLLDPEVFIYEPPVMACSRMRDRQIILRNRTHELACFDIVPSSEGGYLEWQHGDCSSLEWCLKLKALDREQNELRWYKERCLEVEEKLNSCLLKLRDERRAKRLARKNK